MRKQDLRKKKKENEKWSEESESKRAKVDDLTVV